MLTDQEVRHIATLARIDLDDHEKTAFKKELSSILSYIDTLESADTEGVEPLYQSAGLSHTMRADEHRNIFPFDDALEKSLLGQAPMREGRFIKVKSVLKK